MSLKFLSRFVSPTRDLKLSSYRSMSPLKDFSLNINKISKENLFIPASPGLWKIYSNTRGIVVHHEGLDDFLRDLSFFSRFKVEGGAELNDIDVKLDSGIYTINISSFKNYITIYRDNY